MAAERQTIRDRLPPVRSSRSPNASIRRRCASHRPTCQRHVGSASPLFPFWERGVTSPTIEWGREVARLALPERKPQGRDTGTKARFQNGGPALRFPAVVRRPEPRHIEEPSKISSASLRYFGAEGELCVFALEKADRRRKLVDEEPIRSKSKRKSASICVICGFSGNADLCSSV